jgi:hypothetical protein
MIHLMSCRRKPCRLYIHLALTYILCWSLKRSVKRTWAGSAFSTNEIARSVRVTGSQSRVWSGPHIHIGARTRCTLFVPFLCNYSLSRDLFNVVVSFAPLQTQDPENVAPTLLLFCLFVESERSMWPMRSFGFPYFCRSILSEPFLGE